MATVDVYCLIPFTIKSQNRAVDLRQMVANCFQQTVDLMDAGKWPAIVVMRIQPTTCRFLMVGTEPL